MLWRENNTSTTWPFPLPWAAQSDGQASHSNSSHLTIFPICRRTQRVQYAKAPSPCVAAVGRPPPVGERPISQSGTDSHPRGGGGGKEGYYGGRGKRGINRRGVFERPSSFLVLAIAALQTKTGESKFCPNNFQNCFLFAAQFLLFQGQSLSPFPILCRTVIRLR